MSVRQKYFHHRQGQHERWAPSPIRRLVRKPYVWWALVAGMAIATVGLINGLTSDAVSAREQWGETVEAVVATRQVEAGDRLGDAVEVLILPKIAVPTEALSTLAGHHVARTRIYEGEVVVAARVTGEGAEGLAGRLPPDTSAIAVPSGPGWPPLAVGDLVDLHATVHQSGTGQSTTERVAERAVIIDVADRAVTVAVPADQIAATATALSLGIITVALVG